MISAAPQPFTKHPERSTRIAKSGHRTDMRAQSKDAHYGDGSNFGRERVLRLRTQKSSKFSRGIKRAPLRMLYLI